ncbi:unnamed protein product, partial [marine sediment metagenome]
WIDSEINSRIFRPWINYFDPWNNWQVRQKIGFGRICVQFFTWEGVTQQRLNIYRL